MSAARPSTVHTDGKPDTDAGDDDAAADSAGGVVDGPLPPVPPRFNAAFKSLSTNESDDAGVAPPIGLSAGTEAITADDNEGTVPSLLVWYRGPPSI